MNAQVAMKFNNKYHVELIDSITGKVKQTCDFHNSAVKGINCILVGSNPDPKEESDALGCVVGMMQSIDIGSGTTEVNYSDTSLANKLWNIKFDNDSKQFEWVDDYTGRCTATYTVPATSDYVGTITEVGLRSSLGSSYYGVSYSYAFCTRALLTDSEGQPISFNKTDTDILIFTVTCEVTLSSLNQNFKIFKHPFFVRNMLEAVFIGSSAISGTGYFFPDTYGSLNLCRFDYDLLNFDPYPLWATSISARRVDKVVGNERTSKSFYNDTEAYLTYNTARLLATDITSETYFKAIALPSIGYWELPNEATLPAYKITGIQIGTGDGSTTVFSNPISYFKANTEKVYKNGVQLTRGVDYTLSNIGNINCLPELMQINAPIKVVSNFKATSSPWVNYSVLTSPMCLPAALSKLKPKDFNTDEQCYGFDANNPIYVEYEEAVTLNCLKANNLTCLRIHNNTSSTTSLVNGIKYYVDYSIDGSDYIEAGSIVIEDARGTFTLDFDKATAKYWRIRTSYINTASDNRILGCVSESFDKDSMITLNYKNPDITFAEAPAEGDILTMDVDMDLIMKNENFVVDIGCRIDFSV